MAKKFITWLESLGNRFLAIGSISLLTLIVVILFMSTCNSCEKPVKSDGKKDSSKIEGESDNYYTLRKVDKVVYPSPGSVWELIVTNKYPREENWVMSQKTSWTFEIPENDPNVYELVYKMNGKAVPIAFKAGDTLSTPIGYTRFYVKCVSANRGSIIINNIERISRPI